MNCRILCCRQVTSWSGSGSGQPGGSIPLSAVLLVIRSPHVWLHMRHATLPFDIYQIQVRIAVADVMVLLVSEPRAETAARACCPRYDPAVVPRSSMTSSSQHCRGRLLTWPACPCPRRKNCTLPLRGRWRDPVVTIARPASLSVRSSSAGPMSECSRAAWRRRSTKVGAGARVHTVSG